MLRNTTSLQYLVNERLAKRGGMVGSIFKALEMGKRQYGRHAHMRWFKYINFNFVSSFQTIYSMRMVLSRSIGVTQGPINFSGLFVWFFISLSILTRFNVPRGKEFLNFQRQDSPMYWYTRFNIMFPPSFMHHRLSAHYIEINHIFAAEMLKKYVAARQEILDERDKCSDFEKHTRYATNPNYVYEGLGEDAPEMAVLKANKEF